MVAPLVADIRTGIRRNQCLLPMSITGESLAALHQSFHQFFYKDWPSNSYGFRKSWGDFLNPCFTYLAMTSCEKITKVCVLSTSSSLQAAQIHGGHQPLLKDVGNIWTTRSPARYAVKTSYSIHAWIVKLLV